MQRMQQRPRPPRHRRDMLRDSWKSAVKVFVIALIIDAAYQFMLFRWFSPGETFMVAYSTQMNPRLTEATKAAKIYMLKS